MAKNSSKATEDFGILYQLAGMYIIPAEKSEKSVYYTKSSKPKNPYNIQNKIIKKILKNYLQTIFYNVIMNYQLKQDNTKRGIKQC